MPVPTLVSLPVRTATFLGRRALGLSFGVARFGVQQALGLLERGDRGESGTEAYPTDATTEAARPAAKTQRAAQEVEEVEEKVDVVVDEFGAVGSFTDNTGVEPDGVKAPFAGYDKLGGDRVMAHVAESTDLPDLQVLLAYEEAHKNRKGVVQAVEARLAQLGTPVS